MITDDTGNGVDSDSDIPSQTLEVDTSSISGPNNGTLSIDSDGSFTYTPNEGTNGTDSFCYTLGDGAGGTDTATVTLNMNNNDPVATDDTYDATAGLIVTSNVLTVDTGNGADSDDDIPASSQTLEVDTSSISGPNNGLLSIDSDGSFAYTPNEGTSGTDSFTYTVVDGVGGSNTATVTLNMNNSDPVATDDVYTDSEDIDFFGNVITDDTGNGADSDADTPNQSLEVDTSSISGPSNGTLSINSDGSFVYTPNESGGTDSFTYQLIDGWGGTDTATVTMIAPTPPTPVPGPENGKVSDLVWRDDDRDGVQDSGEPGISAVTGELLDEFGTQVATTTTDANGHYEFTGLASGKYQLKWNLPAGYFFTKQDVGNADGTNDSDADPTTGKTRIKWTWSASNAPCIDSAAISPGCSASV